MKHVFVGFGFGAIQGGLFLHEAHRTGRFDRLVVAEVMADMVEALRRNNGRYHLNIATRTGLETHTVDHVEALNPCDPGDRARLVDAVREATEMATALPSVDFFDRGHASVAGILAEGLLQKRQRCVLYAGENHNHAAELLDAAVRRKLPAPETRRLCDIFQPLNTVIGKMSKVVTDAEEIHTQGLTAIAPSLSRAFLVEEFNHILVSRVAWKDHARAISCFEEKEDLLPFEEAKLYGHNAVHALLGYWAHSKAYRFLSDAATDSSLMTLAREAFLEESGRALIHRRAGTDPLFTPEGYRSYADDLLLRMVNPWLRDTVLRVIRDPLRKLGWNDRLFGTMRLALDAGITPHRFAAAAAAALQFLASEQPSQSPEQWLEDILARADHLTEHLGTLRQLILPLLDGSQAPRFGSNAVI